MTTRLTERMAIRLAAANQANAALIDDDLRRSLTAALETHLRLGVRYARALRYLAHRMVRLSTW